jgi:hypothetical protein
MGMDEGDKLRLRLRYRLRLREVNSRNNNSLIE